MLLKGFERSECPGVPPCHKAPPDSGPLSFSTEGLNARASLGCQDGDAEAQRFPAAITQFTARVHRDAPTPGWTHHEELACMTAEPES